MNLNKQNFFPELLIVFDIPAKYCLLILRFKAPVTHYGLVKIQQNYIGYWFYFSLMSQNIIIYIKGIFPFSTYELTSKKLSYNSITQKLRIVQQNTTILF